MIILIENNKLTQGHAKILVGMENAKFLAYKIVEKKLSVRQSENLVNIFKKEKILKNKKQDPNIRTLQQLLSSEIGLNVSIKNKKNNTGSITIEYKAIDQLNRIIEIIKSNY